MSISLNIHGRNYGEKLHIKASANLGVDGSISIETRNADWSQNDQVTIFTEDKEMAQEMAKAINAVTEKYRLKLVA